MSPGRRSSNPWNGEPNPFVEGRIDIKDAEMPQWALFAFREAESDRFQLVAVCVFDLTIPPDWLTVTISFALAILVKRCDSLQTKANFRPVPVAASLPISVVSFPFPATSWLKCVKSC